MLLPRACPPLPRVWAMQVLMLLCFPPGPPTGPRPADEGVQPDPGSNCGRAAQEPLRAGGVTRCNALCSACLLGFYRDSVAGCRSYRCSSRPCGVTACQFCPMAVSASLCPGCPLAAPAASYRSPTCGPCPCCSAVVTLSPSSIRVSILFNQGIHPWTIRAKRWRSWGVGGMQTHPAAARTARK